MYDVIKSYHLTLIVITGSAIPLSTISIQADIVEEMLAAEMVETLPCRDGKSKIGELSKVVLVEMGELMNVAIPGLAILPTQVNLVI